ncbi:hypothetical protein Sjap_000213 [Stephania japonica]|uniref:Choline transporter-like protein n=1 Tax=Stephania japonica TaxID=461633 RepID=A0AAP0KJ69_9MAGN
MEKQLERSGDDENGESVLMRHDKKCRDVVFLIIFIAFWVGMVVNASFAFKNGDPSRLTFGLDYKGNICGSKHANPNLHELDVRYWLNPTQVYDSGVKNGELELVRSICLMECTLPSEDGLSWVCLYPEGDIQMSVDDWIERDYDYFETLSPDMKNSSLQLQGPCYPVIFPSVNVHWSCQFIARASNTSLQRWKQMGGVDIKEDIVLDKSIHQHINSHSAVLKVKRLNYDPRYVADIGKAWPVLVVCGGIVPLFLSVFWLLMIRYFVVGMTWMAVIFFNALLISVTIFCYIRAGWIGKGVTSSINGEHDPYIHVSGREQNHLHAIAVLMTVMMAVGVLSSIAIIRRILKATSVLKASNTVAAKVIAEAQALIVFPVVPYMIVAIFYILWFSVTLQLFSSGQILQNDCKLDCCAYDLGLKRLNCTTCCGYSIRYTHHIAVAILFHLFGCYWATQFFVACSSTVIAGSVAAFYWPHSEALHKTPFLRVFSSLKRLMRYSLGSVALGSLIAPLVEGVRSTLELIRFKLKNANAKADTCIEKLASGSSRCCLGFISWTVKSVNSNAYIMIAITGKGFFSASEIATELIIKNIHQIGRVNIIGDIILFLGKLCVSLSSVLFAFLMLDADKYRFSHNKISSPLFPVLISGGLGYVVARLFFGVVEMSIDSIILSFCQDTEEHHGNPQHAPTFLKETFNDQSEFQRLIQSYS